MATKTDEEVVEEFFVSAVRAVDTLVTSARRKGHATSELAVVLERRFDGKARAASVDRADLISRVGKDRRIGSAERISIVELFAELGENHVPVVLFVETEGFIVVGIRRWSVFPRMEADAVPARRQQSFG